MVYFKITYNRVIQGSGQLNAIDHIFGPPGNAEYSRHTQGNRPTVHRVIEKVKTKTYSAYKR